MRTIISPVLSYMSFSKDSGAGATVSADNFKKDQQTSIDNGYSSVSLSYLNNYSEHEKVFCIVMYCGYSNHNEIAFSILKGLNKHAAAFIPTELVGRTECPITKEFSNIVRQW